MAVNFASSSAYFTVSASADFNIPSDLQFCWGLLLRRTGTINTNAYALSFGGYQSSPSYNLNHNNPASVFVQAVPGADDNATPVVSPVSQWVLVVWQTNAADTQYICKTIAINGSSVTTGSESDYPATPAAVDLSTLNGYFGGRFDQNADRFWQGDFHSVFRLDQKLTDQQIVDIAQGQNLITDLALSPVAYWIFDSATSITDLSGNGHTLTAAGSPTVVADPTFIFKTQYFDLRAAISTQDSSSVDLNLSVSTILQHLTDLRAAISNQRSTSIDLSLAVSTILQHLTDLRAAISNQDSASVDLNLSVSTILQHLTDLRAAISNQDSASVDLNLSVSTILQHLTDLRAAISTQGSVSIDLNLAVSTILQHLTDLRAAISNQDSISVDLNLSVSTILQHLTDLRAAISNQDSASVDLNLAVSTILQHLTDLRAAISTHGSSSVDLNLAVSTILQHLTDLRAAISNQSSASVDLLARVGYRRDLVLYIDLLAKISTAGVNHFDTLVIINWITRSIGQLFVCASGSQPDISATIYQPDITATAHQPRIDVATVGESPCNN